MLVVQDFRGRFPLAPVPLRRSPTFTRDGLVLGLDTVLVRAVRDPFGGRQLDLEQDEGRLLVLLSVVADRPVDEPALLATRAAAHDWWRGDAALAHLRLAFARLPQIDDLAKAYRLQTAEYLLDKGLEPAFLAKELGFDRVAVLCRRYNPNQPRVPAGNGRESGRFGDGSGAPASAANPAPKAADRKEAFVPPVSSLLADAAPEIIAGLARFASRFSVPTAVLGALFIPTPNSGGVTSGTLPGCPDVAFEKDDPAGLLRLRTRASDGTAVDVVAENHRGLYVDVRTGQPIGRNLDGQLYLDFDAVDDAIDAAADENGKERPDSRPKIAEDEPKLCPAPTKDVEHGAQGLDYEDDVHLRVNPLAPIPRGFGVNLIDPATGRLVFLDDCFRYAGDLVDGDMHAGDLVEAKGTVAFLYLNDFGKLELDRELDQAAKEMRVAKARGVGLKWYFAEKSAADFMRRKFAEHDELKDVVVGFMPPRSRK